MKNAPSGLLGDQTVGGLLVIVAPAPEDGVIYGAQSIGTRVLVKLDAVESLSATFAKSRATSEAREIILCALAAMAIMRIISRLRRQRELRRTIWHGIDASQDLSAIEQAIAQKTKHLEDEPAC